MERRKFVIGLGSLAAGGAAAAGTGAFNIATAERDVSVEVAGDADAYLGLEAVDEDYADVDGNTLELNFDDVGDYGDGVNDEAVTAFLDLFEMTNQGTETIQVTGATADDSGSDPQSSGYTSDDLNNPIFSFDDEEQGGSSIFYGEGDLTGPDGHVVGLDPGDSVVVHATFDTTEDGSAESPVDDPDDPDDIEAINLYAEKTSSPDDDPTYEDRSE